MKPTLKWKVNPAPTGRYRSFEKRQWPTLMWEGTDRVAAQIECDVEYSASRAKEANHPELTVRLFLNMSEDGTDQFQWKKLKLRFRTLDEAKDAAHNFITTKPKFWPNELKPQNQDGTKT